MYTNYRGVNSLLSPWHLLFRIETEAIRRNIIVVQGHVACSFLTSIVEHFRISLLILKTVVYPYILCVANAVSKPVPIIGFG